MAKKLDPKVAEKVMLKAGLKPIEPYKRSDVKWKCRCLRCNSIVSPRYKEVSKGGSGCWACGQLIKGNKKRISQTKAVQVMLRANIQPLEPYKLSGSKWKCKCLFCNNIIFPTYSDVQKGTRGCVTCGRKSQRLKKQIPASQAVNIMLKAKLKPLEPYKNDNTPWKSKCLNCDKVVNIRFRSVQRGSACKFCGINSATIKKKRKDAYELAMNANMQPLEPYKTLKDPWKCRCMQCNNISFPRLTSLMLGSGCKYCAERGFNPSIPAYLYIVTNEMLNSHKIGIGNPKSNYHDRLYKLKRQGWLIYKMWDFKSGNKAWEVEKLALYTIRKKLNIPIHLTKDLMRKTGGHTETINADSITLLELEKIINKAIKGYRHYP